MMFTSFLANKIIDWLHRAQAYTPPTTNFSVGILTTTNGPRANSLAYALNNTISLVANDGKTHMYKCTTAGTTAAAQSTLYPGALNEAITDGSAVFTEQTNAIRGGIGGVILEAAYAGYARANLAASAANWAATNGAGTTTNPSSGTGVPTTSNNSILTFGTAATAGPTYAWATASFDATTAGNMLEVEPLAAAKTINNGDPAPTYAAGALTISIDN